jgi:hypothetical protein
VGNQQFPRPTPDEQPSCLLGQLGGPHLHDIALEPLLPVLCQANVGGLSIEFANPRRQHELAALSRHRLPDDMVLLLGVIDSKSNFVEHPEVVVQRIEAAAEAIGDRERVIASCDCGFGTFAWREWGHRGRGVGEAAGIPPRCRDRVCPAVGQEGGLTPLSEASRHAFGSQVNHRRSRNRSGACAMGASAIGCKADGRLGALMTCVDPEAGKHKSAPAGGPPSALARPA